MLKTFDRQNPAWKHTWSTWAGASYSHSPNAPSPAYLRPVQAPKQHFYQEDENGDQVFYGGDEPPRIFGAMPELLDSEGWYMDENVEYEYDMCFWQGDEEDF